ncbi:MAG: sigma factor-like helix-turn-helix DNA-binding protein [Planctomycetota bacterium]
MRGHARLRRAVVPQVLGELRYKCLASPEGSNVKDFGPDDTGDPQLIAGGGAHVLGVSFPGALLPGELRLQLSRSEWRTIRRIVSERVESYAMLRLVAVLELHARAAGGWNKEDREDAVGDVRMKVLEMARAGRFHLDAPARGPDVPAVEAPVDNLVGYAKTMITNKFRDSIRKVNRRPPHVSLEGLLAGYLDARAGSVSKLTDHGRRLLRVVSSLSVLTHRTMREMIAEGSHSQDEPTQDDDPATDGRARYGRSLTPDESYVLHLRFVNELTLAGIAEELQTSKRTVERYQKEGLTKVAAEIRRRAHDNPMLMHEIEYLFGGDLPWEEIVEASVKARKKS